MPRSSPFASLLDIGCPSYGGESDKNVFMTLDTVEVDASGHVAGPNGLTAPLSVRIDYGKEVRPALISCRLDAKGRVITVT
ncbi:hypothetical protein SAMN04488498_1762 [Mesorhizobium albiziae]|uniref:Uncharacterized protein n=2 Tax=Neomesorhizobium albiziae TaxID=335020 RepID=A0A1I4G3U5_9HYPH|nr:hypothetical protein SAMN04488498_1762 [Mesorhizobium albiziae]